MPTGEEVQLLKVDKGFFHHPLAVIHPLASLVSLNYNGILINSNNNSKIEQATEKTSQLDLAFFLCRIC